jgi:phosphoglycerol transferase
LSRSPADSETYGLKIAQLLLPVTGHRLPAFAALKSSYAQLAPLNNENDWATLGIGGSLGFIFLVATAAIGLLRNDGEASRSQSAFLPFAASATIWFTLLGSIGGFGSLFAFTISPQIRSYNRVSIYIAFFSLAAVATLLDRLLNTPLLLRHRWIGRAGVALLLTLCLLDQTSPSFAIDGRSLSRAFYADRRFVRQIERSVARGALIFQLPYMTYPEASEYDHARGYIHSRTLRWSYGAMINERSDLWQREVQMQPVPEMVRRLRAANFAGIYVDRRLYGEKAAQFEQQLGSVTGPPAVVSDASQLSFFDLRNNAAP